MRGEFLLSVMRNQIVIESENKCFNRQIPSADAAGDIFCFDLLDGGDTCSL